MSRWPRPPVLGPLLVRDITTAHVIKLLDPIWLTKTETATRVRSLLELVLDFGTARGLREGPNPARWRGNLHAALPKPARVAKVQHHPAVPVADMAAVMARLRRRVSRLDLLTGTTCKRTRLLAGAGTHWHVAIEPQDHADCREGWILRCVQVPVRVTAPDNKPGIPELKTDVRDYSRFICNLAGNSVAANRCLFKPWPAVGRR